MGTERTGLTDDEIERLIRLCEFEASGFDPMNGPTRDPLADKLRDLLVAEQCDRKAAVALMHAMRALRYITGEDVPGMDSHLRPADVASAALGAIDVLFPGATDKGREAIADVQRVRADFERFKERLRGELLSMEFMGAVFGWDPTAGGNWSPEDVALLDQALSAAISAAEESSDV